MFLSLGWGVRGSWPQESPSWPPSSFLLSLLTQTPRAPRQTPLPAPPPQRPMGQECGGAGDKGAAVRSPQIPGPGVHLQTDVSNNSPSTRRAKTAGGLAETEVKVNCFTAVLPTPAKLSLFFHPQLPPLLPKSQDTKSVRMDFMWSKKVGCGALSPSPCLALLSFLE